MVSGHESIVSGCRIEEEEKIDGTGSGRCWRTIDC